jgi:predicted dehydrogenase
MLRGALLGAGNIAQAGHLPAYLSPEVGERCRIVAAADLCEENLQRLRMSLPGLRTFRNARQLLADVRPDFVDICAPPYVHREFIELAVDFGCHILCEKPLALTLADAQAVQECLDGVPLVFVPGHQYHYAPAWRAVTETIASGRIGRPLLGSITIERLQANDGNPHWLPLWRTSESLSGGGILMDHGTHLFYQLSSIFGKPRRVTAQVETRRHVSYGVEDSASCLIEFGVTLVRLDLTWAGTRRRTTHRYVGSLGEILCDAQEVTVSTASGVTTTQFDQSFSGNSSHSEWYAPLLLDFLGRVASEDYDRAGLNEAVATMECAAAAYDAARTGCAVELPNRAHSPASGSTPARSAREA